MFCGLINSAKHVASRIYEPKVYPEGATLSSVNLYGHDLARSAQTTWETIGGSAPFFEITALKCTETALRAILGGILATLCALTLVPLGLTLKLVHLLALLKYTIIIDNQCVQLKSTAPDWVGWLINVPRVQAQV